MKKKPSLEVTSWWGRALVGRRPKWTLARIVVLVFVSFVLIKFVLVPIRVVGTSMSPTYHDGRFGLVSRIAYRSHKPKRGDVVAVRLNRHRLILLKRVVGLPGESISLRLGHVVVNGHLLDEPYAKGSDLPSGRGEFLLGEGEYFVIGDNRDVSVYGKVRADEIIGKFVF